MVARLAYLHLLRAQGKHPLGDPEGGLRQVEIRALVEMALGAGASGVKVSQGRTLTDKELMARQFPADNQVLE